jgi:hypothetical protein
MVRVLSIENKDRLNKHLASTMILRCVRKYFSLIRRNLNKLDNL